MNDWTDPRHGPAQHGWEEYAAQNPYDPYLDPNSPYFHGYPAAPPAHQASGSAVAALICSSVATAACCNVLAIPAIITSAMAISRSRQDPASARRLTALSWWLFGGAMSLVVLYVVVMVGLDVTEPPTPDGPPPALPPEEMP